MEVQPELLGRLVRALAKQPPGSLVDRLCAAFGVLVGADGVSIAMGFAQSDRNLISATGGLAEELENLQEMLREGPSLDAFRMHQDVSLAEDWSQTAKWPLLVQALADVGEIPAIHAFPMRSTGESIGTVTAHLLDRRELALPVAEAQALADAVGLAIVGQMNADDWGTERWGVRDAIAQATGMVVAQLRMPPDDAIAVLRAHSFAESVALSEVCRRVVARELSFADPGAPDEPGGSPDAGDGS